MHSSAAGTARRSSQASSATALATSAACPAASCCLVLLLLSELAECPRLRGWAVPAHARGSAASSQPGWAGCARVLIRVPLVLQRCRRPSQSCIIEQTHCVTQVWPGGEAHNVSVSKRQLQNRREHQNRRTQVHRRIGGGGLGEGGKDMLIIGRSWPGQGDQGWLPSTGSVQALQGPAGRKLGPSVHEGPSRHWQRTSSQPPLPTAPSFHL